ncbi:hypothetical protein [Streptomyces sp. NBC_00083]|uniref:hypothetical protein n=1 Tax=Streptomyces sp. NBC_00083 TaxID=2975647 RepID=UPI00224CBD3F|nr:hypothetical protein [Streptomyces sp. NBC_00083]MCX5387082.1 hypothetical protein [Streptomyces sp. NBC_00083]
MPSGHLPHPPSGRRTVAPRTAGATILRPRLQGPPPGSANAPRVAYDAFRMRYEGVYVRYARVRLHSPEAADLTVRAALEGVAERWHLVLREASPAAACWSLVRSRIADTAQPPRSAGLLTPDETDMLVLRYRLGLPVAEAASVMGMDAPRFAVGLGGAIRLLTSRPGSSLREAGRGERP